MPIDLSQVNWIYVGVLAVFAFFGSLVGNLLALNHRGMGAILAALIFAALFVFWTYYPHQLPLPTQLQASPTPAPAAAASPPPAAPVRPANPVTTISPPPPPRQ